MRSFQIISKTIIVVAMMLVALVATSQAATPTGINVQGRLTDATGTVVPDGTYSVVFTIYDALSGGTSKWAETQLVTTSGGLFSVVLGVYLGGLIPPPITDSVFNGSTRYLGVKVGTDPELTPRTQLVTSPYAFRVSTVDGATGGAISGNINLDYSTATSGNILKAGIPFIHNFGGLYNTFIGFNAGNFTMSGSAQDNTGCGAAALQNNTTGRYNTASGAYALSSNTTGWENTADGDSALSNNTGAYNTAVGFAALQSNTSGNDNTADGTEALASNTTGGYNTAIGFGSLLYNTVGGSNTAGGYGALQHNTTGNSNTATGTFALYHNLTGYSNTASGILALQNNTTGFDNTADGDSALSSNTVGSNNTASGNNALSSNATGYANTANGGHALNNNTSGNNNTAGGFDALYNDTSGSFNTADGVNALYYNSTGTENTAYGVVALATNSTGSDNTAIGYTADVSTGGLTNATAIGARATVNASNKIRFGDANVTVIEGQVAYTFTSDRNQKENFRPVDGNDVLRKIRGLKLTSWNYKKQDPGKFRHYGPVAQEFYAAFGHDAVGQCGDSTSINSGDETGILLVAVQTLEKDKEQMKAENAELKSRLETLETAGTENKDLRSKLDDLKKMVTQLLAQSKPDGIAKYSVK